MCIGTRMKYLMDKMKTSKVSEIRMFTLDGLTWRTHRKDLIWVVKIIVTLIDTNTGSSGLFSFGGCESVDILQIFALVSVISCIDCYNSLFPIHPKLKIVSNRSQNHRCEIALSHTRLYSPLTFSVRKLKVSTFIQGRMWLHANEVIFDWFGNRLLLRSSSLNIVPCNIIAFICLSFYQVVWTKTKNIYSAHIHN